MNVPSVAVDDLRQSHWTAQEAVNAQLEGDQTIGGNTGATEIEHLTVARRRESDRRAGEYGVLGGVEAGRRS